MKKSLPTLVHSYELIVHSKNTKNYKLRTNNSFGFTLIELLVVISILAVLAVIGFAAFGGLTGRGNDARRSGDIKAISDAMEVKKGTNTTYQQIVATDFTSGSFPKEPTPRTEKYCYLDGIAAIDNPAIWSDTACPGTWANTEGPDGLVVTSDTATYYKVCTMNEIKDAVICAGSRQ